MRLHANHVIALLLVSAITFSAVWLVYVDDDNEEPLPRQSPLPLNETKISFNSTFVCDAWIADNFSLRAQGLIGTTHNEFRGMLFLFDDEAGRSFHMQGMAYSIDIMFLDANKTVVDMLEDFSPNDPNYSSSEPAKYVLEIVSGRAQELNITVGSELEWTL